MAGDQGYYRMWRGWMDHPALNPNEPFSTRDAFQWMIAEAAYKPHQISGHNNKIVDLERGQFATSIRFMARKFGWSDNRIRRMLNRLQGARMVNTVTDTGQTVISICNYDQYQNPDFEANTGSDTGTNTGTNTNKKKGIEERERKGKNPPYGRVAESDPIFGQNGSGQNGSADQYAKTHFDEFWKRYPRKVKKQAAEKTYLRKVVAGASPTAILDGLKNYLPVWKARGDPEYTPHASTWLNAEQWTDELPDPEAEKAEFEATIKRTLDEARANQAKETVNDR